MIALRSEPKTLNPILSVDVATREVLGILHANLIDINRASQNTEPGLAQDCIISPDGLRYTLHLRRDVRFSDGIPFDADDVIFTFQVYLDAKLHSPQRDLLLVGDKPVAVRKLDAYTVAVELAKRYAPGERLFDGIAILPRHLLEKSYREGTLGRTWDLSTHADQLAGLGPFRFKEYVPGERLVVERNPFYWKLDRQGRHLPYLERIVFSFVPNDDAQVLRFLSQETQILERIGSANFNALQKQEASRNICLRDLGPGLEYVFLLFNLNPLLARDSAALTHKQEWFRDENFRKAISAAVDRESISQIAYSGHASAIWGHVTPGNRRWIDLDIPHPQKSLDAARVFLSASGFRLDPDGTLVDAHGTKVEFTILTAASSAERVKTASLLQADLEQLGIRVQVVPLEFRSLVDRVLNSKDYELAVMNLVSGDADPGSEMNVWLSSGATHLWNLSEAEPQTSWEAEINQLMEAQLVSTNYVDRKRLYDRVQLLVAGHAPMVFLVSPHILVGFLGTVGNVEPAILFPYALWNADRLFIRTDRSRVCQ